MVGADGVCRIRKNANPKKEVKFTGVRERYERANLKVGALDALIRFVRYCSGQASEKWMIHIQDADCVQVLSDSESKRDWTVRLTAVARCSGKRWESELTKEELSVCLATQFRSTADRDRLLKDLKGEEWKDRPYWLIPYRTFPEIRQPGSEFLLRQSAENPALYLLREADCDLWREEAVSDIYTYLEENLENASGIGII